MWQQVELALSQSAHRVLVKLASFLPAPRRSSARRHRPHRHRSRPRRTSAPHPHRRKVRRAPRPQRHRAASPTGLPPTAPPRSSSRVAFWGCVLIGCFIGISAFDAAYPGDSQISTFIFPYLTHSIGAVLLLIAGTVIARFLERSVLIGAVNAKLQYARFLSLGIKWLVLVLTAAMVLDHLQIGGAVVELAFGILFGGIVLTLALAVGLGSRDIVSRSLERSADHAPHRSHPRRSRLQVPNAPGDPTPLLTSATKRRQSFRPPTA